MDIFQPILLVALAWNCITICDSMLLIQMQIVKCCFSFLSFQNYKSIHISYQFQSHPRNSSLAVTALAVFYAFGSLFLVCDLGQRLSNAYDEIDFVINQLDWYQFPDEIRQVWPIIINMVQQSVEIRCFGSVSCNRETLKKVSLWMEKGFKIRSTKSTYLLRIFETLLR